MSHLCFIPARGGSKRIPRKNVRPLAGKLLLAYTIEAARDSGLFREIVVSSDDDEVLAIANDFGATGDRRPEALGGDRVRFVEVLAEYLQRSAHCERFTDVSVLLPTCPFRTAEDIHSAAALRHAAPDSFVISLSAYDFPPEFACDYQSTSGVVKLRQPEVYARSTQSQSVTPAFHPNGAIYMGAVSRFLDGLSFFQSPLLGYLMPPERSLDLDHPHQWEIAEALMQMHLRNAEQTAATL